MGIYYDILLGLGAICGVVAWCYLLAQLERGFPRGVEESAAPACVDLPPSPSPVQVPCWEVVEHPDGGMSMGLRRTNDAYNEVAMVRPGLPS